MLLDPFAGRLRLYSFPGSLLAYLAFAPGNPSSVTIGVWVPPYIEVVTHSALYHRFVRAFG